ncbi:MAG: undecaprenyl-diphosphate phosphatase [Clostridia bacterium]|nr:undecaprenyl-diphosphate phosphatase [Clostridia bacterium]
MTLIQGIILGVVQGFTEFLPVSSSGHLTLFSALMELPSDILFTIVVHLGTLLAVIIAFWEDVVMLIKGALGLLFDGFKTRDIPKRRLVLMLLTATLPLVIGALLNDTVEAMFGSPLFVGCALLVTACVLFVADRHGGGHKTAANMTFKDAAVVGCAQLIALFPGISRSGSTMCAGLFTGLDRDFAVRFAFLLSIPAVAGSFVFKLPDLLEGGMVAASAAPYIAGFVASVVCGYLAIKLVNLLVKKNSFRYFSYYCAAVGVLTIILNLI